MTASIVIDMNICVQITDLEEKPTQVQQSEFSAQMQSFSSEKSKDTPNERKTWSTHTPVGVMTQNRRILRSSNQLPSHGSVLVKGTESLRELRRKQDARNRSGVENTYIPSSLVSASLIDEKVSGARHIDPSKAFARVTRSMKPFAVSRNRINKEQTQKVKERDVNTRVWSR